MIVFKILNKVSGQHYVGSCRGDIFERWQLYLNAAEAGLDFPLYQEIREHGEAKFTIAELDFAEDISELKEMELLHTIELNARSLRSHKLGLSENVVKRRRQLAHENAWKKEIPAEDKSPTAAPTSKPIVRKAVVSKPVTKKAPINTQTTADQHQVKTRITAPQANTAMTAPKAVKKTIVKGPIEAATTTNRAAVKLSSSPAGTQKPDSGKLHNQNADDELQKTLFAESVGLLVRTLSSVEQINSQQQRARDEAESLSQALIASDNALQQLLQQQQQAAAMAEQAMTAVAASQQANQELISAQQQALQCSASTLDALDKNQQSLDQNQLLQQQLTDLLGRLKNSSATTQAQPNPVSTSMNSAPSLSKPSTSEAALSEPSLSKAAIAEPLIAEVPGADLSLSTASTASKPSTTQPLSVVTRTATATNPTVVSSDDNEAQRQLLQAEESKMVNQLKQLSQLLDHPAEQSTVQADQEEAQPSQIAPARAWVAGAESDTEQLLTKKTPTIIRRRGRTSERVARPNTNTTPNMTNADQRPTISRKRLSIKAN